ERLHGMQEVSGSIPLISTILSVRSLLYLSFLFNHIQLSVYSLCISMRFLACFNAFSAYIRLPGRNLSVQRITLPPSAAAVFRFCCWPPDRAHKKTGQEPGLFHS
ncbi:hypothetical protein, partial [Mixta calida]|uniref:hypothetical protein n=1 Tax=Mixta calida TaxID=665913 RepID=UPI0028AF99D9